MTEAPASIPAHASAAPCGEIDVPYKIRVVQKPRTKKYRYVVAGNADPDAPASAYGLVAPNRVPFDTGIRIEIPEDMELDRDQTDSYATTGDSRTLRRLGAKAMVRVERRWREFPELMDVPMHEWHAHPSVVSARAGRKTPPPDDPNRLPKLADLRIPEWGGRP